MLIGACNPRWYDRFASLDLGLIHGFRNKPFVTEFLVQNSRKILIEGLDTDVANDAVVPEHDAPLGFTKRVKELCGEAVR